MSRHAVTVQSRGAIDDRAVIGYDAPMRTYFLQAFRRMAEECPEIWLGMRFDEFPTLSSLIEAARSKDCAVVGLSGRSIRDMVAEASAPPTRSLAERARLTLR